jgi:hypothetical protein
MKKEFGVNALSQMGQGATAVSIASTSAKSGLPSATVAEWASRINSVWAHGTTCTLELAKVVHAARRKLPHGEWTRLWKSDCVPFSKRKAEMLAAISRNLDNLNAQTVSHLPSGWSILYRLALLDRATLETEIEAGAIHPGMRLRQAKDLLAKFRGQSSVNRSRKPNIKQRLQKFAEFVSSTWPDWSPEDRELARAELARLADEVGMACGLRPFRSGHSEPSILSESISFSG